MTGKDTILQAAQTAGVVGAGGAGFPTHIKLDATCETFLVNGAECEPLLRVDQALAATQAGTMIDGLLLAMAATGASNAIVGLKEKYNDAIQAVQAAISSRCCNEKITIGLLPDIYPAGDEHVLVYELTGRIVPQGGLPISVGMAVANVETLINLAKAVAGQPVIRTWLTVGGAVAKPMTVEVPLGVSMADVISSAGGPIDHDCALIEGGPMMGRLVSNWTEPVTKLSKGLLLLPWNSPVVAEKRKSIGHVVSRTTSACDQCRNCTDLCPRYLLGHDLMPHEILRAVNNSLPIPELLTQSSLCSECGLCSLIACPASLWPRRVNAELKSEFRKQSYPYRMDNKPMSVRPERAGRLLPTKRLVRLLGLEQWNTPAPVVQWSGDVEEVVIKLKQNAGMPASAVVSVGDKVQEGQMIALAEGKVSVNLHASIAGEVTSVTDSITIRRCR